MKTIKTKTAAYLFLFASACLLALTNAKANNVAITNVGIGTVANTLTFTISWDNSWRVNQPPYSNDAVWVFVKYSNCIAVPVWTHATLSTVDANHSAGAGLEVKAVTDGMGVFVQPNAIKMPQSSIAATTVTLTLTIPAGTYNFRVFGIEMVYTPQGDFQVGDGASASIYTPFTSTTITSTHETAGINANTLLAASTAVPVAYPVGWVSFYCMKYEISQQEWVDFLNSLTYDQQAAHTIVAPSSGVNTCAMAVLCANRNGIKISATGVASTTPAMYACDLNGNNAWYDANDGMNVAANYLSWGDLTAYLDWAALRPMTELEYEKVCRGTNARVVYEWAYGGAGAYYRDCCGTSWVDNTPANSGALTVGTSGYATETSTSSGNALAAFNGSAGQGPLRVGFSATSGTTRTTSCSGFYGAMDLTGNVWERTINATNADGVAFTGILGNGYLTPTGTADTTGWPTAAAALGSGYKGAAWNSAETFIDDCACAWRPGCAEACVSYRNYATTVNTTRTSSYGGRGVR